MINNDQIIRTKLHLPFTRPNLVPRPHLQAQIAEGLRGPLTLVTAPAGFGKTTLVASCVAETTGPVAWLSLDKNDNQTGCFLNYLTAALNEIDDSIGNVAAQLMAGLQQAPEAAILTSLVNDLGAVDRELALVLDDYQLISSQAVHEAVTFLLEHRPENFHMAIATRSDPPLPLARLRARGQVVELRADDLRFSAPEAAQFLNGVMGLNLDSSAVALLEERTEGWIAGLQMAALSMRDRKDAAGFIAGFSGTNRYILDYLLEEVLASQPSEIQHFLLYTSILERLTAPLIDAILSDDESLWLGGDGGRLPNGAQKLSQSAAVLESLERQNLFVVPLDDERTWYRYHHLFANLLRARLQQANSKLIPILHIRAAAWLEQNGWINEAIHHLFAAEEMDRAAELIERYGPVRLAMSDPSTLQMADGLPQEMILARPKIGLYQAWLFIIQARIGKALPILHQLARPNVVQAQIPGQSWMQTIAAVALAFLSPPQSTPQMYPLPDYRLVEAIPDDESILRNTADFLYGMALARRGELNRAVAVAVDCLEREGNSRNLRTVPTLASFLSRLYLMQGQLHATAALCHKYLDPVDENRRMFIYTTGSMKVDLGEVLSEWNCLDEAELHIREGLLGNESWRNIMTDGFGLVALTRVQLAKGDYNGALQAADRLEARLREGAQPREFDEDFRTLRIRVQLASGDLQTALQWADQILTGEDFDHHPDYYRLVLARIRLAQGKYTEVETLLAGRTPEQSPSSQISRQLESNLLLAVAFAGQQRLSEAYELLESSLALAEPEGYIRIFLDAGEPGRDLLAAYLRSDSPSHALFAQKIMETFSKSSRVRSPSSQPTGSIEALSARELEVLQLMATGRTNPEIARQLIVAPGTVKAHTASIYRKLEAANRTEAVSRARKLGILK